MKEKILEILAEIRPEVNFIDSKDFIEDGYIDSFGITTLISELEREYEISILDDDILPENFNTIEHIINLINKYK